MNFTPVTTRSERRARVRVWAGVLLWAAGTTGCAVVHGWQTVWWHGLIVAPGFALLLAAVLIPRMPRD